MKRKTAVSVVRGLGLGLFAATLGATAAMSQAQTAMCPFSSGDVNNWYAAIGFDAAASTATRTTVSCSADASQATFDQTVKQAGSKIVDGQPVSALVTAKKMMITVSTAGWNGQEVWKYDIEMVNDGADYPPASDPTAVLVNGGNPVPLSGAEAQACMQELMASLAWTAPACSGQ